MRQDFHTKIETLSGKLKLSEMMHKIKLIDQEGKFFLKTTFAFNILNCPQDK